MCICFVLFCLFVFQKRILFKRITAQHSFYPGGEYSSEFFEGVCRPVLQILPLFQTKKNVIFHTRCQTKPPKSIPVFRPGLSAETILSLLRLERKQKNSSNPFRIRIFLFLSYSFGIETINTFIHSRSSLENHTRFQTKMGKVYTRFQNKTAQKPTRWDGTYLPL